MMTPADRIDAFFKDIDNELVVKAHSNDEAARERLIHELSVVNAGITRELYTLTNNPVYANAPEFVWDEESQQSVYLPTGADLDHQINATQEGWDGRGLPPIERFAAEMEIDRFLSTNS